MKRCIIFAAVSTEEQTREGKSSITDHLRRSREAALKILADDSLWAMDGRTANQLLRKILGNLRILCNDGEVVGMRDIKHG